MTFSLPPVVRSAQGIARDIELAVARFPRMHKDTFGTDLRARAWAVLRTANRAARDHKQQATWLERLVWEVDELKLSLQLGKELSAFRSFAQFEHLMRKAAEIGRQVGGWYKQHHPKGQNAPPLAPAQRAQTLSTCSTSSVEVNS
ncbi:MAG: four helix bundle protein [Rhodanobacter sp.]